MNQFIVTMKSLSSRARAPYRARLFPEDPKADLNKLLAYVGDEGIEFINLTNEGVTREHPTTIRRVTRDQLATQIKKRRGEQLLWLMERAHFLRWWVDRPQSIESPDKATLVVTFTDDYILTFRDRPDRLLLVKVESLRDPDGDGGV